MRNIIGFINNRDFTFSFLSAQSILPKELSFVFQVKKEPLAGAALSTLVAQAELSGLTIPETQYMLAVIVPWVSLSS